MSVILDSVDQITIKWQILNAIDSAFNDVQKSEPELVSKFAYYITDYLNNSKFKNIHFKAGSIFIHQKPYVKNISNHSSWKKKYVELGDLLLINNLVKNDKIIQRTALLMQAKKFSIAGSPVHPDNLEQLDLYSNWPRFEYIRCPELNGQERYIDCRKEADIFKGAKYLLINKYRDCKPVYDYVAVPTMPALTKFEPLYSELFDFITGNAGKEFIQLDCGSNDIGWNRIIYDLIDNIYSQKLSIKIAKNSPTPKKIRGFGYIDFIHIYADYFNKHGFVIQSPVNTNEYDYFINGVNANIDRINADKENIDQPIVDKNNNNFGDDGINADEENNDFAIIEITTVINSDNENDDK